MPSSPPIQTTPPTAQSNPSHYPHRPISLLVPGPIRVTFTGMVVNIFGYGIDSTAPKAAKGCLKLLLKDQSREILVKLWYAESNLVDEIRLGTMLSVSATHISAATTLGMDGDAVRASGACVVTSIFPERDAGCAARICGVEDGEIGMVENTSLDGLMSLEAFVGGEAEGKFDGDVKLLVCVVAVGELVTIPTRNGSSFQVIPIQIIDTSTTLIAHENSQASAVVPTLDLLPVELSLSSNLASSAKCFVPTHTILLLTSPKVHSERGRKIKLTPRSQVFVNPSHPQTVRLRHWIENLQPPCNITAQELSLFTSQVQHSSTSRTIRLANFVPGQGLNFQPKPPPRKQYTLTLLRNQITIQPQKPFIAYISVLITRLDLCNLWNQNALFCMPCSTCNSNIYSNNPLTDCNNCPPNSDTFRTPSLQPEPGSSQPTPSPTRNLRFNPFLLSGLSDETNGLFIPISSHSPTNPSSQTNHYDRHHHNLYITDSAIKNLTGLIPELFMSIPNHNHEQEQEVEKIPSYLRSIEKLLLYRRVTLVIGWSGDSTVTTTGMAAEKEEGDDRTMVKKGRVIVLDVVT